MTGARAITGVSELVVYLVLMSALVTQGVRAENPNPSALSTGSIHFDLPAQPLAQALHAYGQLAELAVMAQAELLDGRTSGPVNGNYSAHEALQRLLAGTGLQASFQGGNEAIIRPLPLEQQPQPLPASSTMIFASSIDGALDNNDYVTYNAMVQTRLTQALCASIQTRPGSYRLVVQLRIGDTGVVVASRLVSSTGLPERDAAIERAMQGLELDSAPPAGLQEPVTILLRPQGNGVDTDCAQFDVQGS